MRRTVINPVSDDAKNNDSVTAKPPMIWRVSGSAVPARGRVTASLFHRRRITLAYCRNSDQATFNGIPSGFLVFPWILWICAP
jgi:hypothetical protein